MYRSMYLHTNTHRRKDKWTHSLARWSGSVHPHRQIHPQMCDDTFVFAKSPYGWYAQTVCCVCAVTCKRLLELPKKKKEKTCPTNPPLTRMPHIITMWPCDILWCFSACGSNLKGKLHRCYLCMIFSHSQNCLRFSQNRLPFYSLAIKGRWHVCLSLWIRWVEN